MSHNVACIGNGYVWPSLVFTSEGDRIEISSQATEPVPAEPISYRHRFTKRINSDDFEMVVDRFIQETIEVATSGTDLPELWKEVLEERNDSEATELRKLEAYLGYDAGEAPEELLDNLLYESEKYGAEAVQEVAAFSKDRPWTISDCSAADPATRAPPCLYRNFTRCGKRFRTRSTGIASRGSRPNTPLRKYEESGISRRVRYPTKHSGTSSVPTRYWPGKPARPFPRE